VGRRRPLRALARSFWGGNPVVRKSRADYFEHALPPAPLVVGINTSAFIEAVIVGRPGTPIVVPEMGGQPDRHRSISTICSMPAAGCSRSRDSVDEHLAQLDASLARADLTGGLSTAEIKPFVREFVAPNGLPCGRDAGCRIAVESMAASAGGAATRGSHGADSGGGWRTRAARTPRTGVRADGRCRPRELSSLEKLRGARVESRRSGARASVCAREARARRARRVHAGRAARAGGAAARREGGGEDARQLAEESGSVSMRSAPATGAPCETTKNTK
jgi:hypothetical protein